LKLQFFIFLECAFTAPALYEVRSTDCGRVLFVWKRLIPFSQCRSIERWA